MKEIEKVYNPIWDGSGKLREGCTVKMALDYFTEIGMTSDTNITINGTFYTIRQLDFAPGHPEIMGATIKALDNGYYGSYGFRI